MASPCVSQAAYHSATTASVVWLLALDFIFTRCVSPCPQNFNIGCCANEKPLRLIAHRRVRFFTFMFVSTLVLGEGGSLLNPIQASESIVILETNECTSSVVSSPPEPRFVLVPIGFASEAWPRPGLAEPCSASIAGFGLFHQHIRKGKIVITKTSKEKRLLLGSFLAPETDMILGDGVGASLVST